MTRLYFVRHGQSLSNVGGLTMEHATIPLTPLGLAQAEALAEHLQVEPSRVLTSSFTRARDTAQRFCDRTGRQAEISPLLHEFETIDPDLLAGMTGEQRRPIADAYWSRADPHERMGTRAETFSEFEGRVTAFMEELASLPDRSVMFGHGMWMGLMVWKLLGLSANDSQGMRAFRRFQLGVPISNCVVYVLESAGASRWTWAVDERMLRLVASVRLEATQISDARSQTDLHLKLPRMGDPAMSDALPDHDQRSDKPRQGGTEAPAASEGTMSRLDDLQRVGLGQLISEGRKSMHIRPSTEDVLARLDTFQAAIEAKLDELSRSIAGKLG